MSYSWQFLKRFDLIQSMSPTCRLYRFQHPGIILDRSSMEFMWWRVGLCSSCNVIWGRKKLPWKILRTKLSTRAWPSTACTWTSLPSFPNSRALCTSRVWRVWKMPCWSGLPNIPFTTHGASCSLKTLMQVGTFQRTVTGAISHLHLKLLPHSYRTPSTSTLDEFPRWGDKACVGSFEKITFPMVVNVTGSLSW